MNIKKLPTRKKTLEQLEKAEDYFAELWLIGAKFVNKSLVNTTFGRRAADVALNRYFNVVRRGSNVSGKMTEIVARNMEDLPNDRQEFLLKVALTETPPDISSPPTDPDLASKICIQVERCQEVVDWCVETHRFQFIRPVQILMRQEFWDVFYKEKTDRFFAVWPFCLTNWPTELRKKVLRGVDYDLNNAIGQFVVERSGVKLDKYSEAKEYLLNPKKARGKLEAILGIDTDQAKKVLHATMNGCAVTKSAISNNRSALVTIISKDQALKYIEFCSKLIRQLGQLRKAIAPDRKAFMREYFAWEKTRTGLFFNGTGLLMHDGADGCAQSTIIPAHMEQMVKQSDVRGTWMYNASDETLIKM